MKIYYSFKRAIKSIAVFIMTILIATSATAGPIVTDWTYSTDATFSDAVFGIGAGTTTSSNYELSWGYGGGDYTDPNAANDLARSALTVGSGDTGDDRFGGGPVIGGVSTVIGGGLPDPFAGEVGLGVSFTHWNNAISSAFATLLSATVTDTLTLTPFLPNVGPGIPAPTLEFDFEFRETANAGPCAGGTPTPCGDLFGFTGTPTLNIPLFYDGNNYVVDILILGPGLTPSPIGFLNDGQCAALGFTTGISGQRCQGFLTPEDAHTTVQFGFDVRHIPEPGTMAIFIIGIACLSYRKLTN
ncbi:THxN family PEP-CTERM protein [Colwelliaceae bacterium 6471]